MNITSYILLSLITLVTLLTVLNYGILIRTALSFIPNYDFTIMKWINNRNYNSHVIFLKISISIILVSCPILFYKLYTSFSFLNESLNIVFLIVLSIFTCYLIYFNKYKVWSDKNNFNVKEWIPDSKRIDRNTEKIELCNNKQHLNNSELETHKGNTSKSITDLKTACAKTEKITLSNKLNISKLGTNQNNTIKSITDLKIACVKTEKNTLINKQNISTLDADLNDTDKSITDLKIAYNKMTEQNTIFPTQRISSDKQIKIQKIKKEFKKLLEDLKKFPEYNPEHKTLNYKDNDLTELQAYQTLVIFFKDNYEVPNEKFNNTIFDIFNNHFSIKNSQLKSGNWSDFKNRLLPNIKNNTFYSNLCLIK